jgi:hypothetical protein
VGQEVRALYRRGDPQPLTLQMWADQRLTPTTRLVTELVNHRVYWRR